MLPNWRRAVRQTLIAHTPFGMDDRPRNLCSCQPFGFREFETHPMLDFRSNELSHLEEALAGKVRDIRVAQDLLQEVLGVLGQFGGTDAPGNRAIFSSG